MADILRIKRRASGGAAGAPASLAAAELAYNEQDDTLYYGWGNSSGSATVVKPIAGPGAFAPIASPTFTGDPKAPTPTPGDNDTSIATTAFVTAAMTAAGSVNPSNTNPLVDGTAAPGTSALYARGDHVHPSNTASIAAMAVRYDAAQTLTAAQQIQGRANIYAAPFDAMAYNGVQINGGMTVNQNAVHVATAAAYVGDCWKLGFNGTMALDAMTDGTGATDFPHTVYRSRVNVTTAQASMSAANYAMFYQPIEGYRVNALAWGTANAKPITIGFWTAHVRTGTYSVVIQNAAANRSYATTYTQASPSVAQYNVITVPGDTTGTWPGGNAQWGTLMFAFACGTTLTVPANNAWQAGNYVAATGQVNAVAALTDAFRITDVVILPGSDAPTAAQSQFIMRPYDQELATCQRYYYRRDYTANQWITTLQAFTTSAASGKLLDFPCKMRAAPTSTSSGGNFTVFNSTGSGFALSGGTIGTTQDFAYLSSATGTGLTLRAGDAVLFSCNASTYHIFDARF